MEKPSYFHYKIFDSPVVSEVETIENVYSISSCGKFKLKFTKTQKGNKTIIIPILVWNDPIRPPVGFWMETVEFNLKAILPQGSGYKIFQHGYQSWSFSCSYSAKDKDKPPILGFLQYSQENIYSNHSGLPGDFLSEGFVVLYNPSTKQGFLAGVFKLSDPGVRFHIELNSEGEPISFYCIFDFHCSPQWKGSSKIPLPEIIFYEFKGNPEVHMEMFFKELGSQIPQPPYPQNVPTGWCSWYYYYTNISEKVILDNLKEVKKKNLPIEFFQIDDGYQKAIGDWLHTNEKFPAGMKILAEEIKKTGYKPGIWLAPFLVRKEAEIFNKYPEAILKDQEGEPVPALWNPLWGKDYTYCLDVTHPISINYLKTVFHTITKEWGYHYLKLDFLYAALLPGNVYDSKQTPQRRYQNILKFIRKIVGKDTYLLGCGAPIIPSIGFFQGMRISCDVAPFWKPEWIRRLLQDRNAFCTEKALVNTLTRAGMHHHLWYNDPDCLIVRKKKNKMNYKQTLIMASVMALSGGMLLISDDLTKLEEDRLELLLKTLQLSKKCMKKTPLPIGIFQETFPPALYNPTGYLGIWNPTAELKKIELELPFSLPTKVYKDYWTDKEEDKLIIQGQNIQITLEPFGCRVFSLQ